MTSQAKSEAALDRCFTGRVRLALGGVTIKLAPTTNGVPDRLVILPGGTMHLVELKTWNGEVSEIQKVWHDRTAALGVTVAVLYGEDGINAWVDARKGRAA